MENFDGKNTEERIRDLQGSIEHFAEENKKLDIKQEQQEIEHLRSYLSGLEDHIKKLQNNPNIEERFKKGQIEIITKQIVLKKQELEKLEGTIN